MAILVFIALYLAPLFLVSIGVNYYEKQENIKRKRPTTQNTFWLTVSSSVLLVSVIATVFELT